jgi:hypothetical protein
MEGKVLDICPEPTLNSPSHCLKLQVSSLDLCARVRTFVYSKTELEKIGPDSPRAHTAC